MPERIVFLKPCRQFLPPHPFPFPFHSAFTAHSHVLLVNLHNFRHSPPIMPSITANAPAVPGFLALSVTQPHTTTPSGLTLGPPSPPMPSSSSHSGPMSSHLSVRNSSPSSSSSLGSNTLATQRQEIQEAWIDAEGEIPVSRLQR